MAAQDRAVASSSKSHHHHHTQRHTDKSSKTKHGDIEKEHEKEHRSKHRYRGKENDKGKRAEKSGPFEQRLSYLRLSVPPKFSADWLAGVREVLDGLLIRYVPQMCGVLLAHGDHEFVDDTVKILNECPFGVCEVEFRSIVWAPKLGQRLYGTHSLSSPSHLSLVFSRTFNVSIPLQHIPLDLYEFEHTEGAEDEPLSDSEDEDDADGHVNEVGRWKTRKHGKLLGEGGKGIKFTVIGMQVSNQMLSLTGSLLADPANPPPPSEPTILIRDPSPSPEPLEVEPPEEQPRHSNPKPITNGHATYDTELQPRPEAAVRHEVIDERFLSARELKKRRKDETKDKREERKAKKGEVILDAVETVGGGDLVGLRGSGGEKVVKRKADGDSGEMRKKRRDKP